MDMSWQTHRPTVLWRESRSTPWLIIIKIVMNSKFQLNAGLYKVIFSILSFITDSIWYSGISVYEKIMSVHMVGGQLGHWSWSCVYTISIPSCVFTISMLFLLIFCICLGIGVFWGVLVKLMAKAKSFLS